MLKTEINEDISIYWDR